MMELCIHPSQTSNQRTILRIIEIINFDILIKLKGCLVYIQVISQNYCIVKMSNDTATKAIIKTKFDSMLHKPILPFVYLFAIILFCRHNFAMAIISIQKKKKKNYKSHSLSFILFILSSKYVIKVSILTIIRYLRLN